MGRKFYSGDAGYPANWKGLKSVLGQLRILERMVVTVGDDGERNAEYLDASHVHALADRMKVPAGWDGIAIAPKPAKLSTLYRGALKGYEYNRAYAHALQIMVKNQKLTSDPGQAFETIPDTMTGMAFQKLMGQPGDFLVFPVQLGRAHPGKRMDYELARLAPNEVPLDPYLAACVLLTHPERLATADASAVCCPGAHLRMPTDRVPIFRKAGIQLATGGLTGICLQVRHIPLAEQGWIATAMLPGL